MKNVSSRSLLAVAVGMVVWTGCMNPSTLDRDGVGAAGRQPLADERRDAGLLLPSADLVERAAALRRRVRSRSLADRSHRSDRSDERLHDRQRRDADRRRPRRPPPALARVLHRPLQHQRARPGQPLPRARPGGRQGARRRRSRRREEGLRSQERRPQALHAGRARARSSRSSSASSGRRPIRTATASPTGRTTAPPSTTRRSRCRSITKPTGPTPAALRLQHQRLRSAGARLPRPRDAAAAGRLLLPGQRRQLRARPTPATSPACAIPRPARAA